MLESPAPSVERRVFQDALHVSALSALAIAQPLLVRLSDNAPFLLDTGSTPRRLGLLAGGLMLIPPAVLIGLEGLARCAGSRWRVRAHFAMVALLAFLLGLLVGRRILRWQITDGLGVTGFLVVTGAVAGSVLLLRLYRGTQWMPRCLSVAAVLVWVFPVAFLTKGAAAPIISPAAPPAVPACRHPVPVVLLVFDEFCGMTLVNENHEIDAVRYPSFARLAQTATWYRNATTVHSRTDQAVPAILTGRWPKEAPPTLADTPQNLFTLMPASENPVAVFEPVSRLAPTPTDVTRTTFAEWSDRMTALAPVYVRAVVPADLPVPKPEIPNAWYGLADEITDSDDHGRTRGYFRGSGIPDEDFEHFLRCLPDESQPGLFFLHVVSPHQPWRHLPDGKTYRSRSMITEAPLGGFGDFGEDWTDDELILRHAWQRYLFEVEAVDRRVGQIMDRLQTAGMLDECLLIVMADHGVSFRPGQSRRVPQGSNLEDILPIPLFIKLPRQQTGRISDRNVESIDILPTIADVLGAELAEPVDGMSVLNEDLPARPRKSLQYDFGARLDSTIIAPDFPQKYGSVDRMLAAFGSGTSNDRLRASPLPSDRIGRPLTDFTITPTSLPDGIETFQAASLPDRVVCCFEGAVQDDRPLDTPLTMVIAVNGRVAAVTRTSTDPRLNRAWCCIADERFYHPGDNEIRLFSVNEDGSSLRPEPCSPLW